MNCEEIVATIRNMDGLTFSAEARRASTFLSAINDAADLLEQQAARIAALESKCERLNAFDKSESYKLLQRVAELEAQLRIATISICETCRALAGINNRICGCARCIYRANSEAAPKKQEVQVKDFKYGDWADGRVEIPTGSEEQVLCIVNGKPTKNVTLRGAYLLGNYFEGEGWCMEQYPDWDNPEVVLWTPLPDTPKEVQ